MTVFVGCDLGTMGTKAAVVDEEGRVLGDAFEEVALHSPQPGIVEQRFEEIEASAHRTIRTALGRADNPRDVGGVSFSSQMSGIGTIDSDFQPATPYDSWLDTRCEPQIEKMAEHSTRVAQLSGCPPTYSHGPKILWLLEERPEDFSRVARFIVPGAYVAGRLCGLTADEAYIDRTYLHFSNLSDTVSGKWSPELLDLFGVDEAVLPRIVHSLDVVGEVTPAGEQASGIPAGTPVAAGAGDQAAASLGAGVVDPGQAFDSAGTASVFAICVDEFSPDVERQMFMATHSVVSGVYVALAFINGGGLALRWFRDEVARFDASDPKVYEKLDALATQVEPGAGGLLWFPHFQGRVLPPRPSARGAWVGLTSGHTMGHMFRAILEGIAYEYAEWARAAASSQELDEARVLGGGARSGLWNQIKADVLGIDWVPMVREECGVLGNALIAAAATGHVTDIADTAKAWQETRAPVQPDPKRHRRYQGLLDAYRELATGVSPVFEKLARS